MSDPRLDAIRKYHDPKDEDVRYLLSVIDAAPRAATEPKWKPGIARRAKYDGPPPPAAPRAATEPPPLTAQGDDLNAFAVSPQSGLTRERLAAALPHAVNFHFLPPRVVKDPIWLEVADAILEALATLPSAQEPT